ncbi:hypothetical protein O181_009566 [Austropuccinia psidii MF-1]|uniref:Uncharacterized protein n=1 Tax=Austropuccinia psidii MF-1 TaxID=1389203 RepID=A0A9Q3BS33_9BASI|nr:hypothetical protein [Austropuccinia psidii MF-1]
MTIIYKEGKVNTNADGLNRFPLKNNKANTAYDPESGAKIQMKYMEIYRKRKFKLLNLGFQNDPTNPAQRLEEDKELPILGIIPSKLNIELLRVVQKSYKKQNQCSILTQSLEQKYRSPEMESQLEEPWLKNFKDKNFSLWMNCCTTGKNKHVP